MTTDDHRNMVNKYGQHMTTDDHRNMVNKYGQHMTTDDPRTTEMLEKRCEKKQKMQIFPWK